MKKIFVQFASNGSTSVYGRGKNISGRTQWRFYYADYSLILSDLLEEFDGKLLPVGLITSVEVEKESLEEGLSFAKTVAESILSLVSLSVLTAIHDCRLIGYVDVTGKRAKSFSYPFNSFSPVGSLAVLKESEFREIFEKYEASNEKPRLMRSLAWLRKGINEIHVIDEFIAYFTGLEILACLLRDRLKMKMKNPSEWEGIIQIFDSLGPVPFLKVNLIRNKLLHGSRELDEQFILEVQGCIDISRRALIKAVGELLDLDAVMISQLTSRRIRRQRFPQWLAVEADFTVPPDLSEDDLFMDMPQVIAKVKDTRIDVGDCGELTVRHKMDHHFVGPEGVSWENIAFERCGDPEEEVVRSSITPEHEPEVFQTTHAD